MKTLVIAPHWDDEAISCGGLISTRVMNGGPASVGVVVVHNRVYNYGRTEDDKGQTKDFLAAKALLGYTTHEYLGFVEGEPFRSGHYALLEQLELLLLKYKPTELIIPARDDLNQDHRHLHEILSIATRPVNLHNIKRVLEFVALDGNVRAPNYYLPMGASTLERKIRAIACYQTEARTTGPRATDNVVAQAMVWGAQINQQYAEAYRVKHWSE